MITMKEKEKMSALFKSAFLLLLWTVSGYGQSHTLEDCPEREMTGVQGQEASICCDIDLGTPNPSISDIHMSMYRYNGGLIGTNLAHPNDPRLVFSSYLAPGGHIHYWLTFKPVTQTDAGFYQCRASYAHSVIDRIVNVNLEVKLAPTLELYSKTHIESMVGRNVILLCLGTGDPEPTMSWYRLHHTGLRIDLNDHNEELALRNLTIDDAGRYQCVADNGYGTASWTNYINITVPPVVSVSGQLISQELHGLVLLTCLVTANPAAEFAWHRGGQKLDYAPSDGHRTPAAAPEQTRLYHEVPYGQYSTMLIVETLIADGSSGDWREIGYGNYSCSGGNPKGDLQDSKELSIVGPGTIRPAPPPPSRVVALPEDRITSPGTEVTLTCAVTEDFGPEEQLTWWWTSEGVTKRIFTSIDKRQSPFDLLYTPPGKFELVDRFNLMVKDVQFNDHGTYACEINSKRNYTASLTVVDDIVCQTDSTGGLSCSLYYKAPSPQFGMTWTDEQQTESSSIITDTSDSMGRVLPVTVGDTSTHTCTVSSPRFGYTDQCSIAQEARKEGEGEEGEEGEGGEGGYIAAQKDEEVCDTGMKNILMWVCIVLALIVALEALYIANLYRKRKKAKHELRKEEDPSAGPAEEPKPIGYFPVVSKKTTEPGQSTDTITAI